MCEGNPKVAGWFPLQRASNAEIVYISCRHKRIPGFHTLYWNSLNFNAFYSKYAGQWSLDSVLNVWVCLGVFFTFLTFIKVPGFTNWFSYISIHLIHVTMTVFRVQLLFLCWKIISTILTDILVMVIKAICIITAYPISLATQFTVFLFPLYIDCIWNVRFDTIQYSGVPL